MTRALKLIRNPALGLPAAAQIGALPVEAIELLIRFLLDLRNQARAKSDAAWKSNKAMMAAYWRIVSVYAGHFARALRAHLRDRERAMKEAA